MNGQGIKKRVREAFPEKKQNVMKKNCKWWGGQLEFISLVQNYICTQNTFKILNKDFIKALRGGVTVL